MHFAERRRLGKRQKLDRLPFLTCALWIYCRQIEFSGGLRLNRETFGGSGFLLLGVSNGSLRLVMADVVVDDEMLLRSHRDGSPELGKQGRGNPEGIQRGSRVGKKMSDSRIESRGAPSQSGQDQADTCWEITRCWTLGCSE